MLTKGSQQLAQGDLCCGMYRLKPLSCTCRPQILDRGSRDVRQEVGHRKLTKEGLREVLRVTDDSVRRDKATNGDESKIEGHSVDIQFWRWIVCQSFTE